ncbi:PREDICTED: inactive serine/threonine-protein kinase/endoribonuclease IRE1-like [Camelina sativa]|uniref:Inactive serine/threonine-protein kinase/endoribonuclease IRE1-like n=1 Tax=Camelina sativa TaxID=90675 RepID=A0ABM0VZF6_CAMSA|nr:PREDICTED: inactive serine/threonine-protein kinase/endoribonuclease IRE1-like [Camelina sativa]
MAFSTSYKTAQRDWYKVQDTKLLVSHDVVEKGHEFESLLGFYDPGKKLMVKRMARSDENKERMQREYTNLEAFQKHPNILEWVTFDEDDSFLYLSQERWSFSLEELVKYFRSSQHTQSPQQPPEHLDTYIKNTGMILDKPSIGRVMLDLMEQVASGLKHLQKIGYVHRDLNPKNIVIVCGTEFMTAKIANFCTAQDSNMPSPHKHKTISHYHTGFQPQEQIKNNEQRKPFETSQGTSKPKKPSPETKDADLFSFGCILFYSLTLGKTIHPNHFQDVRALIRLIRNQYSHFRELSTNIQIQALYKGTLEGMEEYYSGIFPGLLTTVYKEVWLVMRKPVAGYEEFLREYYY